MTNKELISKIREEILHLKMKELQRMNGVNTGADVYLSSYAVLSILSNALTEESEDERIRKELVALFIEVRNREGNEGYWHDLKVADILAYLEKQKEPENTSASTIIPSYWEVEQKKQSLRDFIDDFPYSDEQKEQEPDIELIQRTWYMEGYQDREHNLEPEWIVKTGEDGPRCEENPKYGQMLAEQKPAEWNANDKAFIKDCAHILDENGYAASAERLLSMFPVKPAEWSEEDEAMFYEADIAIVGYYRHSPEYFPREKCESIRRWLKSLRPSWKPSDQDELMKLKYAGTSTKLD